MEKNKVKNTQNLQAEMDLYKEEFHIDSKHWTSSPLLVSRERHWLKNDVEKIRFYGYLARYIKNKPYRNKSKILIAPVGNGSDFKYLQGIYQEVQGIDISPIQISQCPKIIIAKEGDILNSGYEGESFDIIIVALFLHHLHDVGFKPFIEEFYRILRKGGTIAFLEPSSLYPLSWILAIASKFLGEFPAKVKGERPIFPYSITKILKNMGFKRIRLHGMTFNHVVFPFFFQSIINVIDPPFRAIWPFKLFSETIAIYCEKAV